MTLRATNTKELGPRMNTNKTKAPPAAGLHCPGRELSRFLFVWFLCSFYSCSFVFIRGPIVFAFILHRTHGASLPVPYQNKRAKVPLAARHRDQTQKAGAQPEFFSYPASPAPVTQPFR
jgi:hypothetical protein